MAVDELRSRMYSGIVEKVTGMTRDLDVQKMAKTYGLGVMSVTWEDNSRYKNSAVGNCISDLTIQVIERNNNRLTCMPLIRYPNFEDKTSDINMDKLLLKVGNEKDGELQIVTLREYLLNIQKYLSKPDRGSVKGSLVSERDTHVLASAQAAFLPIPTQGKAEFNVVLFNYQAREKDPAVLTILATANGTSATIIDNKRDRWETGQHGCWGQRLFHNKNGERCPLTGERLTDFIEGHGGTAADVEAAKDKGLDTLMLIQVPLKQKPVVVRAPRGYMSKGIVGASAASYSARSMTAGPAAACFSDDVEQAVLGHGEIEGPYTEFDGLELERDTRFPIRVTVQMYKATSNGVVEEKTMLEIANQINSVYENGDWIGSLVTGGETTRPTEHGAERKAPTTWWTDFWQRYNSSLNTSEERVVRKLDELWPGGSWHHFSVDEMDRVARSGRLS